MDYLSNDETLPFIANRAFEVALHHVNERKVPKDALLLVMLGLLVIAVIIVATQLF